VDLAARGWDVSPFIRSGVLRIVDYLSLAEGMPLTIEEKLTALFSIDTDALNPERLIQIFVTELRAFRERAPRRRLFIVFDSIDRLFEAMGLENTLRFAEMAFKTLQGTNSMAVALLCNEFLSGETLEAAKAVASVFIELKREWRGEDIHRMVRVAKSQSKESATNWIPWYY